MAASTYALGLCLLSLCTVLDLFPAPSLLVVALLFTAINGGLLASFISRWNERRADPSLTGLQVGLGVTMVAVILTLGRDVHFVAAPFYSVLFVFGMLKLRARALAVVALYVLVSYGAAVLVRHQLYGDVLDLRIEAVTAATVVGSAVWFAVAASYISNLRVRLRELVQQIAALASLDPLTGIRNRRQIALDLESAVKQAERHGNPLCVLLADVDHFKAVNDRHGHAVGDEVLKSVAACLGQTVRGGDLVARYGGEEFLLVLPSTTVNQAMALSERLRVQIESMIPLNAPDVAVTASFGLAAWRGGESACDLVGRADKALYRAKAAGRNRIEADSLFRALA
jgi:diguanylate cyclase (GGDEF)-like protein